MPPRTPALAHQRPQLARPKTQDGQTHAPTPRDSAHDSHSPAGVQRPRCGRQLRRARLTASSARRGRRVYTAADGVEDRPRHRAPARRHRADLEMPNLNGWDTARCSLIAGHRTHDRRADGGARVARNGARRCDSFWRSQTRRSWCAGDSAAAGLEPDTRLAARRRRRRPLHGRTEWAEIEIEVFRRGPNFAPMSRTVIPAASAPRRPLPLPSSASSVPCAESPDAPSAAAELDDGEHELRDGALHVFRLRIPARTGRLLARGALPFWMVAFLLTVMSRRTEVAFELASARGDPRRSPARRQRWTTERRLSASSRAGPW